MKSNPIHVQVIEQHKPFVQSLVDTGKEGFGNAISRILLLMFSPINPEWMECGDGPLSFWEVPASALF